MASFVAELRRLTKHCDFGVTLEDMLRDRLVCGINEPTLQRRLLAQDKLTFKTALEMSQAWESAGHHLQNLQQSQPSGNPQSATTGVHAVQRQDRHDRRNPQDHRDCHDRRDRTDYAPRSTADSCNSCGGPHQKAGCRYRSAVCNNCGKKGHLARVCHSNARQNKSPTPRTASTVQTHQVQTAESQVEYPLFTIANEGTRSVVVTLCLDDREIDMEVDTGAAVSLISATTYQTLWAEDRAVHLQCKTAHLHPRGNRGSRRHRCGRALHGPAGTPAPLGGHRRWPLLTRPRLAPQDPAQLERA